MKQPNTADIITRTTCRVCLSSRLEEVMNLGTPHISDFPKRREARFPRVPLVLIRCSQCGLVQLQHTAPRDWLYREYFYRSGVNESMVAALTDVVDSARKFVDLHYGSFVLDIGANDGTLLRNYPLGITRVGVDPALNLHKELSKNCEMIIPDYFPPAERYSGPQAKIITSIAMFYDLEDPNAFVAEVARILHPEGVWVVQLTDLWETLRLNAFDNIVAEHLEYYSFGVLAGLFARHGLNIVDVERNSVNGGSVRYYVAKTGGGVKSPEGATKRLDVEKERDWSINTLSLFQFVTAVETIRDKVVSYIEDEIATGGIVDVLGASTKGNTLLQYFGLDSSCIRRAIDRSEEKNGRYCAGSWIPIVNENEGRVNPASLLLCLPWGFRESLLEREKKYLAAGGRILFPLPMPCVASKDGETLL